MTPAPAEDTPIPGGLHPGKSENVKPLAGPIAALKQEIDRALLACDGHLAELAHELLTNAEWAQRCLETVRRCTRG